MIFCKASPFITKLGIVTCVVCSATVRAALVMPGVLGNDLEGGRIGISRATGCAINGVAFGAYLTRQLATLLNTSDLLRVRTSGHHKYRGRDDHASCGYNIDQLHCDNLRCADE